jgi:hypothetical protein
MDRSTLAIAVRYAAFASALIGTVSRLVISLPGSSNASLLFYFTVQSNIMVCIYLGAEIIHRLLRGPSAPPAFRPAVQGAVLLYILVTGIVYQLLLSGGIESGGYDLVVLNINHGLTPLLFLADWMVSQRRGDYRWAQLPLWLIYPVAYGIFASVEGSITGSFRYFFLDFVNQGITAYLIQIGGVTAFFIALSSLIILFNRRIATR